MKLVVIHGSHKVGPNQFLKIGDAVEMSEPELLALDPDFKNGIGHRFASPEKAAKLTQKQKLEAELEEPVEKPAKLEDPKAKKGGG